MPTPAVIQYPTRSAPNVRGRAGRVTPGRWATILRVEAGDDVADNYAREVVINISMTIPADRPPELPGLVGIGSPVTSKYFLERVALGVKIGMIRGGTVDPSGGFGYPPGDPVAVPTDPWLWFVSSANGAYIALFEDI